MKRTSHPGLFRPRTGGVGLVALALALTACTGVSDGSTDASGNSVPSICANTDDPFSTDDASDSAEYKDLSAKLGPVPAPAKDLRIGSVMKFLGNQYWATLSKGQTARADKYGITLDVQAASSESDQVGQLNASETMLNKGYKLILASPQSDTNMCPAVEKAEDTELLVVNVNDAAFPNARQWVGPNQIQNGVTAAAYMGKTLAKGAPVAIIQGQAGVYAAKQRIKGFTTEAGKQGLKVVASVAADWDIQKARDTATTVMQQHPDLAGFYCNNDTMALGVAEAVKAAGKKGKVQVIGTGEVAVDVGLRLLGGQKAPRAVYTPQALITKANVDDAPPTLS